jgi:SPP1 gp7 family putative phage head morphogenesis protein
MLNNKRIAEILQGIFSGDIDVENLPEDLYFSIAKYLEKGVLEGAAEAYGKFGAKNIDLVNELRENVYMFSAAKTYTQTRELQDLMYDDEDNIKPYREWIKEARDVYDRYNSTDEYAGTEYRTAVQSAEMGVRWGQIQEQRKTLPYLLMTVVEDSVTTDICAPLDGVCLPVDDPFWNTYYPPNHFNCRSSVLQLDKEDKDKVSSDEEVSKAVEHANEEMTDAFRMNVGKDRVIYSDSHPYFTVPREDKELAKNNFNLPIPDFE